MKRIKYVILFAAFMSAQSGWAQQSAPGGPVSPVGGTAATGTATALPQGTRGGVIKTPAGTQKLDAVVVQDTGIVSPVETAAYQQTKIPGASSLIKEESVTSTGRATTSADLFKYQAGVFAQAVSGNDSIRVSIRGSGINRGANGGFREGIGFLFDGLPITGPGGTPYELLEPLGLNYTEVLKGPAGIQYGGLALGGVVNYVTKTGYEASPFEARYESGSFGYNKGMLASGAVVGKADYYVAVIDSTSGGFQKQGAGNASRFIGNIGYKFSDDLDTRFYFRFGYTDNEIPGSLTLAQIQSNPSQANSTNYLKNTERRQPGSKWAADKTTYKIDDDSRIELGLVYHDYPIVSLNSYTPAINPGLTTGVPANLLLPAAGAETRQDWEFVDVSGSVRYLRTDHFLDRDSNTTFGLVSTSEVYGGVWNINTDNNLVLKRTDYSGSANHNIFAQNETQLVPELAPKLWLVSAIQGAYIRRESDVQFPVENDYTRDSFYAAPQVGLRYDLNPDVQFYTNVSQNVEPTDDWKYSGSTITSGLWTQNRGNLDDQVARTVEVGTRAKEGIFDGSLSLYRSWINHELLTANTPIPGAPGVLNAVNINGDHTIHQGIEAQLTTTLWKEVIPGQADDETPHQLTFQQAYTLNDFYNQSSPIAASGGIPNGGSKLPGLPDHFYQGQLLYEHSSGFFVGFNTQVASSYAADYANTLNVPSYETYGATIGYRQPKKGWEVYLNFLNLTDEKYVVAISPGFDSSGGSAASLRTTNSATASAILQPGDGFTAVGGISYRF